MKLALMIIGSYTVFSYLIGFIGLILYWLLLERELKKRTGELALEKNATRRFVLGIGFWWWAGSPIHVPQWIIGIPFRRRRRAKNEAHP